MEKETNGVLKAPHTIAQIVKGTTAEFSGYKEGQLFYSVDVEGYRYEFPIDLIETEEPIMDTSGHVLRIINLSSDIGETRLDRTYKAITLMRYIRKAIGAGTLRWDKIID